MVTLETKGQIILLFLEGTGRNNMRRIMKADDFSRNPTKSKKRKLKEQSKFMKSKSVPVVTVYKKTGLI